MSKTHSFLLAASIALVMAFTFSCSSGGGGGNISTCSGKEYDATFYSCEKGELVGSCKGSDYYPEYQSCSNGVIIDGAEVIPSSSSGGSQGGNSGSSGVLSAPTGVVAARNSADPSTVRITWNAVSGAASYNIYWSLTGGTDYHFDGPSTTTSFNSVDASANETWYFCVSAENSTGEGPRSSWVKVGPVDGGDPSQRQIAQLSDSRFNGLFMSYGSGEAFTGYLFDGTNKVEVYISDRYGNIENTQQEWEVSNGRIRTRTWNDDNNVNNPWRDWYTYSFTNNDTRLNITYTNPNFTTYYTKSNITLGKDSAYTKTSGIYPVLWE